MTEITVNVDGFCKTMLRDMRAIHMTHGERARAEAGMRTSAAIIELLIGMAGYIGLRGERGEKAA